MSEGKWEPSLLSGFERKVEINLTPPPTPPGSDLSLLLLIGEILVGSISEYDSSALSVCRRIIPRNLLSPLMFSIWKN